MAATYQALSLMLRYPTVETIALAPAALAAIQGEKLLAGDVVERLAALADGLANADLYDAQAAYVDLFDRTRSLSLQLYEHVHGESRDRGQAMFELLKLYSAHGLELTARELPDHLPVFLEFLSILPEKQAAVLLGEAVHVIEALHKRLRKRGASYACVFDALTKLASAERDPDILQALMREPDDDPNDLAALDRAWAEEQVTFGPDKVDCPKAREMLARIGSEA